MGTIVGTDAAPLGCDHRSDEGFTADSDEGFTEEGMVGKPAGGMMLPFTKVDVVHNDVSLLPLSPQPHSMEVLVKENFRMKSELEECVKEMKQMKREREILKKTIHPDSLVPNDEPCS